MTANTLSRISLALSGLSLIGMIAAFATRTQKTTHNTLNRTSPAVVVDEKNMPAGSRIAYVDIDSLEANYDYFKNKKADFARRQASMESELQRSAQQLQSQAESFQKKVQSGGFTSQAEVDAAGRKLQQMEQSLATRRESLATTLLKEQDAFNTEIQKQLDDFLEAYVQEKPFDYVLSYSKSGSILYANKGLNITREVIEGMNARAGSRKETRVADTAAKK